MDPWNLSDLYFSEKCAQSHERWVHPRLEVRVDEIRGRHLVTTAEIGVGTCLFVIPPVCSANVEQVTAQWRELPDGDVASLEALAEESLHSEMKRLLGRCGDNASYAGKIHSLLSLSSGTYLSSSAPALDAPTMDVLLARATEDPSDLEVQPVAINDERVRGMIRTNAFGPDGPLSYSYWATVMREAQDEASKVPSRFVDMYPLAAMINHSCVPNAVRSFVGSIMVVHASQKIPAGGEVVWPYLSPTLSYPERQSLLQERYSFTCQCRRCELEGGAWNGTNVSTLMATLHSRTKHLNQPGGDIADTRKYRIGVAFVEQKVLSSKALSNELKRYLRVGLTCLYMNHLNASLSLLHVQNPIEQKSTKEGAIMYATELHMAFSSCHNASTEHVSLLHLIYELVSSLAQSDDSWKNKLRFWTNQLRNVHVARYGQVGTDLESMRLLLKHTRVVLRSRAGLQDSTYEFI